MTLRAYHGNTATIEFQPDGGTAITVGWLQDVEVYVEFEESEMTACGSIKIQDRRKHVTRVKVKATLNKMDIPLLADILTPSGTYYNGTTGTVTAIEDTNVQSLFDIVVAVESTDATGKDLTATVSNVVINNLPLIVAKKDDYVGWELEGIGDDVHVVAEA